MIDTSGRLTQIRKFSRSGYARLAVIVVSVIAVVALLTPLFSDPDDAALEYRSEFETQAQSYREQTQKINAPSQTYSVSKWVNPLVNLVDVIRIERVDPKLANSEATWKINQNFH